MAEQYPDDVPKKKRRFFRTDEERNAAKREKKKEKDSKRICLGSAWEEWERQRAVCGGIGHIDFIHHLLAVHQGRCSTYTVSTMTGFSQNRVTSDACYFGAVVPETPQKKSSSSAIPLPLPDDSSPLLPMTYSSGHRMTAGESTLVFEQTSPVSAPMESPLMMSTPVPGTIPHLKSPTPDVSFMDNPDVSDEGSNSEDDENLTDLMDDTTNIQLSDDDDDDEDGDPDWEERYRPPKTLRVTMSKENTIKAQKCIAYNEVLEKLLRAAVGDECRKCGDFLTFRHVKLGTCLVIKWRCPNYTTGHSSGTWASQPMLFGMYAGNLLTPTALILSGNNFAKVALMAKFLKLNFISKASFYRVQQKYVRPAVDKEWKNMQAVLLKQTTEPVVLAGDGRNDSPGHSAKFCTYSLLDVKTNKILAITSVDCRETKLNSVVMEKKGFKRAMKEVMPHINVAEIVTDGHLQITALMRNDVRYEDILHQYDVWHVGKSLTKKLAAAAKEKGCQDILQWITPIRNHLWYCAKECSGSAELLKVTWPKCYQHVCNKHEWLDTTSQTIGQCSHPIPLPESDERPDWIKLGSKAQTQLRNIIWDKAFLKKLTYIKNFRHTGQLELFHALILMYCPKRLAFTNPIYLMRNQLAALDHNHHTDRAYLKDKATGEIRQRSYYSKATKKFSVGPLKEPKEYRYIPDLIEKVVNLRELGEGVERLDAPRPRPEEDPRNIQPNIAVGKKPSIAELVLKQKSRF